MKLTTEKLPIHSNEIDDLQAENTELKRRLANAKTAANALIHQCDDGKWIIWRTDEDAIQVNFQRLMTALFGEEK